MAEWWSSYASAYASASASARPWRPSPASALAVLQLVPLSPVPVSCVLAPVSGARPHDGPSIPVLQLLEPLLLALPLCEACCLFLQYTMIWLCARARDKATKSMRGVKCVCFVSCTPTRPSTVMPWMLANVTQ